MKKNSLNARGFAVLVVALGMLIVWQADAGPVHKVSNYSLNVSNGWSTATVLSLDHSLLDSSQLYISMLCSNSGANTSNEVLLIYGTNNSGVNSNLLYTLTVANAGTLGASLNTNLTFGALDRIAMVISNANETSATLTNYPSLWVNQKTGL